MNMCWNTKIDMKRNSLHYVESWFFVVTESLKIIWKKSIKIGENSSGSMNTEIMYYYGGRGLYYQTIAQKPFYKTLRIW